MRVLVPPPRESRYHEVASATDVGQRRRRREDTHAVFSLPGPGGDWPILVLAVADGLGGRSGGRLASAVAIDALGESLQKALSTVEFGSWTWQSQVRDAMEFAFAHANAEVRALRSEGDSAEAATGLTTVLLISDWLCVGHAGRGRAYRLQGAALEQLTADRSAPPVLGPQAQVLPEIRLTRVEAGDVIAVCSDGLYRYVDGEELGRWLSARDGLMDILVDLLTATADRGGDEDTSVCLCRVRRLPEERLPEPAPRADKTVAAPPELPHFTVPRTARVGPTRVLFALATIAVGIGALGGGLGWWSRAGTGEDLRSGWVTSDTPRVQAPIIATPDTEPVAVPVPTAVPPRDSSPAVASAIPPARVDSASPPAPRETARAVAPAPVPPTEDRDAKAAAARDSARRARREEVRIQDSLAEAAILRQRAADSISRDSVNRATAARRARDSIADVTRAAEEARLARERADATARASAAVEAETRNREVTAGRAVINSWAQSLGPAAAAGDRGAPSISTGPGSFASFVADNRPRLEGVRITGMDVNETTGTATAEWTARWRGEFGTTASRRMRATVEAVREGDVWRITGWRFLEGAP